MCAAGNEFRIEMAPMEGVIDPLMRELYSKIGGIDSFVCEFIRVTKGLLPEKVFYRICPELRSGAKTSTGVPVGVQILGGEPHWMAENAVQAEKLGAKRVDVNFGCPAKTVNKRDGGSVILKEPERVYKILTEIKNALSGETILTAKIRLGFENKEKIIEIAEAIRDANIQSLTVHGRTRMEGFRGQADWKSINTIKEIVGIPVLANGDINSIADYFKCKELSGCQGVVLGRGLFSRPDLALQIRKAVLFEETLDFEWKKISEEILPEFVMACLKKENEIYALSRTKQWLSALSKSYPEAEPLFEGVKRLRSFSELMAELSC